MQGIELVCKVIGKRKTFEGSFKHGIASRSLKGYGGYALKPISCENLVYLGDPETLQKYASNMPVTFGKNRKRPRPKHLTSFQPIP